MTPDSPSSAGFRASDLLTLPPSERRILQWLMRRGRGSVREVAERFEMTDAVAGTTLDDLEKQGFLAAEGVAERKSYQPKFGRSRPAGGLPSAIWRKLGDS